MSKHTQGFPAETPRKEAISAAVAGAIEAGTLGEEEAYSTEIIATEEHKAAGEYVVVVRGKE